MPSVIKQKIRNRVAGVMIVTVFFSSPCMAYASEITAEKIVELTNLSRSEAGLGKLTINDKLSLAARRKAEDMFKYQYFEHISPTGVTPWHWFDIAGYDYIYAAENLAIDFTTSEGAHSAFMKSTGHRENILGASYKEIGVAAVKDNFENKESIIIVEMFGAMKDQRIEAFFQEPAAEKNRILQTVSAEEEQPKIVKTETSEDKYEPVEDITVVTPIQTAPEEQNMTPEPETPSEEPGYGKIVEEMSSIKNIGTLKDAYTKDIYWKKSDGGVSLIVYSKAKLKHIIKNLLESY